MYGHEIHAFAVHQWAVMNFCFVLQKAKQKPDVSAASALSTIDV